MAAYRRGEIRLAPGFAPAPPVPPGATLRRELEARGMSQRKLARAMGRPVQTVNSIVLGRKALTPRTAANYRLALERARSDRGAPGG